MTTNSPYQAPSAEVVDQSTSDVPLLRGTPNNCGAGQGWDWINKGFGIFKIDPLPWIGMVVVYFIIMFVLGFIPFLGSLATMLLGPVFTGGLMIACRNMEQGNGSFSDLFAGFQSHFGPLLMIGLIYFGFMLIAMIPMFLLGLGSIFMGDSADLVNGNVSFEALILGVLIFIALLIPAAMGVWFAPALVVFHDVSAWQSFKMSFVGCLKNILPFLVYGVIALAYMIVAIIPIGLGLLVLVPTLIGAMYVSYQQIFLED